MPWLLLSVLPLAKSRGIRKHPDNTDVHVIFDLLREVGVTVQSLDKGKWSVDGSTLNSSKASYELARKLRASFYLAGLLLAKRHEAVVPLPGGCFLGPRPVDFHLKGFQAFGAEVAIEHGCMIGKITKPQGTRFFINRPVWVQPLICFTWQC